MTEDSKLEKIVKVIVALNPDISTAKKLQEVLQYHSLMKSKIRDAWDYAAQSVN